MEEELEYRPLLSYSKDELVELFKKMGVPSYRAGQIRRWLFSRKTARFSQMSDLSKEMRARLTRIFARPGSDVPAPKPLLVYNDSREEMEPDDMDAADSALEGRLVAKSVSDDGSVKLRVEWRDGRRVEWRICAQPDEKRDSRGALTT